MALSEFITIEISRETTTVSQAGFGVMMVMGTHQRFLPRLQIYSSLTAMTSAGFEVTDPEYKMAAACLAQSPKPSTIAIGRRSTDVKKIQIDTVSNDTDYKVTVNHADFDAAVTVTFTSDADATKKEIIDGLYAALNADDDIGAVLTASNEADTYLVLTADTTDDPFIVSIHADSSDDMSVVTPLTASATEANDLAKIQIYSDDWYGVVSTSRVQADVEDVADWIETQRKLYLTASDDSNIVDDADETSSIAYYLSNATYERTAVMYLSGIKDANNLADACPDAAWIGKLFTTDPGSATWAFKTLSTISAEELTSTQKTNAFAKNANTYNAEGGVNITRYGTVGSGEYLDVMRGIDWLQARLEERIYTRLVNLAKIPFTDAGVAILEAEVRAQLNDAIDAGLLASIDSLTVGEVADVSDTDKGNRYFPDLAFTATLAGAIHKTKVEGIITL